jgi:tRNA(fMet)-specific endonuclease VapC
MPTILLDTDVVSFLIKGDTRATTYAPSVQGNTLAMLFMTVAEFFQWAVVRHWRPRRLNHLEQALAAYLVVPVDIEMCRIWGTLRAERQSAGETISPQDAWIAATALYPVAADTCTLGQMQVHARVHQGSDTQSCGFQLGGWHCPWS